VNLWPWMEGLCPKWSEGEGDLPPSLYYCPINQFCVSNHITNAIVWWEPPTVNCMALDWVVVMPNGLRGEGDFTIWNDTLAPHKSCLCIQPSFHIQCMVGNTPK